MIIGWPQAIYLGLLGLSLIVTACLDGTLKTGTHKFSVRLCDAGITLTLLYLGGFFGNR